MAISLPISIPPSTILASQVRCVQWFADKELVDKELFKNEQFVGILVKKGGADANDPHAVDAISGGTITSKALEDMIYDCLVNYIEYLKKNSN